MAVAEERPKAPWYASRGFPLAAGLVIAAVAGTLLVARAGDEGTADILVRANRATETAGSYRFAMKQGIPSGEGGAPVASFDMQGAADLRRGLVRFVITTRGPGFDLRCTQVASKTHLYTSVHPSRRAQIGAAWVRSGTDTLLAGAGFQFRPDRLHKQASQTLEGLERTGTQRVRGVVTTRYDGDIDLAAFTPRKATSPAPTGLDLKVPVSIFVDERGLMHRMSFQIQAPQNTSADYRVTIDMFDYGKPVDLALPPSRDVKVATPQETVTACFPGA